MKFSDGMAAIEAVLFACGEPVDAEKLSAACEIEKGTVLKMIDRLNDRYVENGSAFRINRLGDSYQMMNQPVTKSFVEQVRGVDSSSVVNNLVERDLLEEYGRLDLPGRPIAYKTTENFLRCFGMTDIGGLPAIPDSTDQMDFDELDEMNLSGD